MKLLAKLTLFFVPLTLLVTGGVIVFSEAQVHKILIGEVERHGLASAKNAAVMLEKSVKSQDESAILSALQKLRDLTSGSYVVVLDRSGTVLAHTNVAESGKIYNDTLTIEAMQSNEPRFHELVSEKKPILDMSMPIFEEQGDDFLLSAGEASDRNRLGTLRLGLPLAETLGLQNKIFFQQASLLSLGIVLLSLGLLFFMVKSILWPTRRLVAGISQISRGQYGQTIDVRSKDELGKLTESFNQMSRALSSTTVSKDYMDAILQHMLDPLFVVRVDGCIESRNSATARLLQYGDDDLVGRPVASLFASDENPFADDGFQKVLDGETIQNLEVSFLTKMGQKIATVFSASALKDKDGKAAGIICVSRDITERKKLEARMLQTDKLSAVGQLAAGVAHEINNPLGIILGFAQSVKSQLAPTDPAFMGLEFIEKETVRCKDLVQNLLVFSRATRTEQREEIDLKATIEEALSLVTAQTRVKNVELFPELSLNLPRIKANKNQIQQIIINLCNNAMDAMSNGGKITVRTGRKSYKGTDWIVIEVKDTGQGIPKDIQAKIFEPFFTTKEVGKGTGLGLSLVFEIVQKHQGTIELESEVGKGATFIVSLPIHSVEMEKAA